jgi:hypothetical protein
MMKLSKLLTAYENDMALVCDTKECTRTAVRIVVVHQVDHCKEPGKHWVQGRGDRVLLMCVPCAKIVMNKVDESIAKMKTAVQQKDPKARVMCTGCCRYVDHLHDICRVVELMNR